MFRDAGSRKECVAWEIIFGNAKRSSGAGKLEAERSHDVSGVGEETTRTYRRRSEAGDREQRRDAIAGPDG